MADDSNRVSGLGRVLRNLADTSTPQNRAVRHLLHLDIHDTWTWAHRRPATLTEETVNG